MARIASSHITARRIECLRGQPRRLWGWPTYYYPEFEPKRWRVTMLSRRPSKYHPLADARAYLRSVKDRIAGRRAEKTALPQIFRRGAARAV